MENKAGIFSKISTSISEQAWFVSLKNKWDELDQQSRTYLTYGGVGGGILLFVFILVTTLSSVYSTRFQYQAKLDILNILKNANQEITSLKRIAGGGFESSGEKTNWNNYFTTFATLPNIDPNAIQISTEKSGLTSTSADELLYEIKFKRISVKQVVQYTLALERGPKIVKVRNLKIDTNGSEGHLDITLAVSAYAIKK